MLDAKGGVGLRGVVKWQVAASMFLNISMETTDRMSLPEFQMIKDVAEEIQKEMKGEGGGGDLMPGTLGRARMF